MISGIVAIVGSPNVGKSTLFNRIVGERLSIVHDEAGVTRDRLYAKAEWLNTKFSLIDTGGIEIANTPFQEQIRLQVEIAIAEADVIIFMGDAQLGLTDEDYMISRLLHETNKPVVVAVNKADNISYQLSASEFYSLGFEEVIAVSTAHGIGVGDVLDFVVKHLHEKPKVKYNEGAIAFSIIGRPNVGKSSLVNAMLNEERVIVSPISGTTRDAIDTPFTKDEQNYLVIDTAGLLKRGRIYEAVDKYAAIRALSAIERSDISLLVIDAEEGIVEQDKHVAGYAVDANKPVIIVVNKWDLVTKDTYTMHKFSEKIRKEFKFLPYAPIVYVSALENKRIHKIFEQLLVVYDAFNLQIGTSLLNEIIQDAQIANPAPHFNKGRLKIYYASQVGVKPPTFVLFCNNPKYMHFSYERYLENRLRESFLLDGTPIKFILRERT